MVGKNNKFSKSNRNNRRFQRFSLRKLSIGVVSVAIAAGFYMGGSQSALADASSPQQAVPVVPGSLNTATVASTRSSSIPSAAAVNTNDGVPGDVNMQPVTAPITNSTGENQAKSVAQNVNLDMYTKAQNNESHSSTITATGNKVVGLKGSFEVTSQQLAAGGIIEVGTISQVRSDQGSKQNISVLIRSAKHEITAPVNGVDVRVGNLHLENGEQKGTIVISLQNLNRNAKFNDDRRIKFDIPVALDLNHPANADAYRGTLLNPEQQVKFTNGKNILYTLTITAPKFTLETSSGNFSAAKLNSGDEGLFSVSSNYVSDSAQKAFLRNPLTATKATLPGTYQWGGVLNGKSIADIQVYGGAKAEALFDLDNKGNVHKVVSNNSKIPLWEKIRSVRVADNLDLSALKKQNADGLIWSRQNSGSINLWFKWPTTRLHTEWVNAIDQQYGSLYNYFKSVLYTAQPGIDPDKFSRDNVEAYQHFLGDNPLKWLQEIHVVSYDHTAKNQISVALYDGNLQRIKVPWTITTNPGKYVVQGHSSAKVHFIDVNSQAKNIANAEVQLPQGQLIKSNWCGESGQINIDPATLHGYTLVDANTVNNRFKIPADRILKSTSTVVTFPGKEGATDDYYVFVEGNNTRLPLEYVDDDKGGEKVSSNETEFIEGKTGSAVAITVPKDLQAQKYELNQQPVIVLSYDQNGQPKYEVSNDNGKVFAIVHLRHQKTTKATEKTVIRTINVTTPDGEKTTTIQSATVTTTTNHDYVTKQTIPGVKTNVKEWAEYEPTEFAGYSATMENDAHQSVNNIPKIPSKEIITRAQKGINEIINVKYTANDQTGEISYVDKDGKKVGSTPLTAKTDQEVTVTPQAPTGYDIIPGQSIPTTVTATPDGIPTITVKVTHHQITVKPGDLPKPGDKLPSAPSKKPGDGKPNKDVTYNDLHKTITRTITINDPHTGQHVTKQTVTFTRNATIDLVNHSIVYSSWKSNNNSWTQVDIPVVSGYTRSQTIVKTVTVTPEIKDINVTINYTANLHTSYVIFQDGKGKPIRPDEVNGQTDETVAYNGKVPAGWKLAKGQTIPASIEFGINGHDDIKVTIEHATQSVSDSAKVTRTINVYNLDGTLNTDKSQKQVATLTRKGTKDLVTSQIAWGNWSLGTWGEFDTPTIDGYTPTQASVAKADVTADTQNQTVNISYTANDQTANIVYKDGNKTIKSDVLSGHTDEAVDVKAEIPTGYHANGNVPTKYIFKASGNQNLVINLLHDTEKASDSKTITRTINVTDPQSKVTMIKQTATLTRQGTTDKVTGQTEWGNWTTASWDAYNVPEIKGYTASQPSVAEADVTADTKDAMIDISYTANDQSAKIIYKDGSKTVKSTPISGTTAQTINLTYTAPDGYTTADAGKLPKKYTFKADKNTDVVVELGHQHGEVSDSKAITRMINITIPDGKTQSIKQTAKLTRHGQKDAVTGNIKWSDWSNGSWDAYNVPEVKGYTASQPSVAQQSVTDDTKDAVVNIIYTADEQTAHVVYKDGDKVVRTDKLTGKTGETVKLTTDVPANYHVTGKVLTPYTFMADGNKDIVINLLHDTEKVSDSQTITRTINVTVPSGKVTTTKQAVKLNRTGVKDLVTNDTTWGDWTSGNWAEYNVPTVAGYTPTQAAVIKTAVTSETKDITVSITYTANDQITCIIYVDKNDHQIKIDTITGKTAQIVDVHSDVPTGWKIVDGQVPRTVHFTGDQTPDTTITVDHRHHTIDGQGELPTGLAPSAFTKTVTRTINVCQPDGTVKTTKQTATFNRIADVDEVMQQVTFGDWQLTSNGWVAFTTPAIDHYTPSQAMVEAVDDAASLTRDVIVDITYTANRRTVEIKYVDKDSNEIGHQMITGHVGDTVKVTPQFPTNWVPMDPATVPTAVRIKEENGQIIIVVIRHAVNDPAQTKTVTRTIRVTTPDGQTTATSQVAKISCYGDLDLVTGQIAWNPWTTARWDAFKPATIVGYTPSQAELPAVTVDGETADQTVTITYAAVAMPTPPQPANAATAEPVPAADHAVDQGVADNGDYQPAGQGTATNAAHQVATTTTHHLTATTSAPVALAAKQTPAAQSAAPAATSRQRLPQTGNGHAASALTVLGLASLLGLLGLDGKRRKRD